KRVCPHVSRQGAAHVVMMLQEQENWITRIDFRLQILKRKSFSIGNGRIEVRKLRCDLRVITTVAAPFPQAGWNVPHGVSFQTVHGGRNKIGQGLAIRCEISEGKSID